MPRGTVEEFLATLDCGKGSRFAEITSHHPEFPGGKKLLVKSRLDKTKKTPYKCVTHVLRRTVLLGANYENMVNNQRVREAEAAVREISADLPSFVDLKVEVEPFIAGPLWGGKGRRDAIFPNYVVRHVDTGDGYLIFWPKTDGDGVAVYNDSRYLDEEGRDLDFEKDLKEFWVLKRPSVNKSQGTKRLINWSTVKLSNIVQINANKQVWDIEPPVLAALS